MQQLLLNIVPDCPATFNNFIPGENCESLTAVRDLAQHHKSDPLIYIWGAAASGKTHLLRAALLSAQNQHEQTLYFNAQENEGVIESGFDLLAIDNVEHLSPNQQIQLFSHINRAREGQGRIVCTGNAAPKYLPLRADLSSRLAWHLVYQLIPLSDVHKREALAQRSQTLGFILNPEHIEFLMRHWRRDLSALFTLIDRLDEYSRMEQRPITLPLLREVLSIHQA
ncbi:MAG: DnaA regulatory inactivator Hda [Betaproteobacteria bacterium]|nr:DnaA regulatory inactivator Hda [Betaproteobacteria bacterium]